jgi:hypothetical protein
VNGLPPTAEWGVCPLAGDGAGQMIEKALGATSTRDISLPRHAFFCLSQTSRSGQLRALPNGTAKAENSLAVPARRVRRRFGEPLVVKQLVEMPVERSSTTA